MTPEENLKKGLEGEIRNALASVDGELQRVQRMLDAENYAVVDSTHIRVERVLAAHHHVDICRWALRAMAEEKSVNFLHTAVVGRLARLHHIRPSGQAERDWFIDEVRGLSKLLDNIEQVLPALSVEGET
ncbi:MAG: hypothetical protein AAGA67_02110 [Cyanobacteria bacterium P01_F01_bin.153]